MKSRIFLTICQLVAFFFSFGQSNTDYSASSIKHALDKLNVLGSVLYIAAHPDDENTALISFYANERKYETAYLSATRGDGGQNLIGPQIREELGIIRTQELQAARRTDGGKQFFTRANDFGYSKHPDETFNIWEKDKVLEDMVWCIRKLRPDVLITRFSTQPGITHGHHTASAILAEEAFDLAGDPKAYESQLEFVDPWQPKKLFWNTSWWFYRNSGQKMDTASLISLNVGGYNPLLGMSYPEIAALSRSQHKSQGFGSSGSRGDRIEYLKQLKGAPSNSVFDGIDTSWDRVVNSNEVSFFIEKAIAEFDVNNPSAIVPDLLAARSALSKLEDNHLASIKKRENDDMINR
ncbi:MAG: PIG-L family deacetylase [Bacteroidota bacterium]